MKVKCIRHMIVGRKVMYPLMSRERYLKLFGMPPEEIFTAEQRQRIDKIVEREGQNATVDE